LSVHTLQLLPEFTHSDLAEKQAEDPEIGDAYRVLQESLDPLPKELRSFSLESCLLLSLRPEVCSRDDVLVKVRDNVTELVLPVSLQRRLFDFTYAGPAAADLGATRMINQLKPRYYWPELNRDVKLWYKQCAQCTQSKGPPLRPHGHLQKIQVGAPLDFVTMDILSGLPTAADGSKYILVVVDGFSKWIEAYSLLDQEASTCMTAVYNGFFSVLAYRANCIRTRDVILKPFW